MRIILGWLEGAEKGKAKAYSRALVRIGRGPTNEFPLALAQGPSAAERHAEVFYVSGTFFLRDLGSPSGTWLNGQRVPSGKGVPLRNGDRFRCGKDGLALQFGFRLKSLGEPVPEAKDTEAPRIPAIAADPIARRMATRTLLVSVAIGVAYAGCLWGLYRQVDTSAAALSAGQDALTRGQREAVSRMETSQAGAVDEVRRVGATCELRHDQEVNQRQTLRTTVLTEIERRASRLEADQDVSKTTRATIDDLSRQVQDLETRVADSSNPDRSWKPVAKQYEGAVVLIYTEVTLALPGGEQEIVSSYGTGFVVSADGLVLTNKHVVQPWKFGDLATLVSAYGVKVTPEKIRVACWPSGCEALDAEKRPRFDVGYNNTTLQNLEVVATAPDRFVSSEVRTSGGRYVNAMVHDPHSNDDLALLRLTPAPPVYVDLAVGTSLEKLDRVMVLGYPSGDTLLEAGRAETSVSLGTVRKVEETIQISAPLIPGNSGGPMFDEHGQVQAIATSVLEGTEMLALCIKVEHARKLIKLYYETASK